MTNPNSHIKLPLTEESKIIFKESLIQICCDTLRLDDKRYKYYTLTTRPYSVVILAQTTDGKYIINEEYRHPTKSILLSCPGGFIDGEENPLEAAKRELLEETGYSASSFEIIGSAYPYPGISSQKTFFIKAINAEYIAEPKLEISEIIRTKLKTKDQIEYAIQNGSQVDASLCAALFFEKITMPV